jgi:A/G-specific adenine glycosylase
MTDALFCKTLLEWFEAHPRPLPWKNTNNAYYIWLSEIILQQTQVAQGLPYYERFVSTYPSVQDLADAPSDEVMKLWEGLGYYSRARNLHETAKFISEQLGGVFPENYEGIRALKGIGDYTAAAIASFAYNLPHAVVDGNVYRVLSRIYGISTPIDSPAGKREFASLAERLLDKKSPAIYNQAIMDFGATHCKPKQALCASCPFQPHCVAFKEKKVGEWPIKSKVLKRRTRYFHYLKIQTADAIFIKKREDKDVWQNLWEFPLIETTQILDSTALDEIIRDFMDKQEIKNFSVRQNSAPLKQVLTHQDIITVFTTIDLQDSTAILDGFEKIKQTDLRQYALPKVIVSALEATDLTLF